MRTALKESERQSARGIGFSSSILFFLGVGFGYYVIAPLSLQFLGNYELGDVQSRISVMSYMKTVASITLASTIPACTLTTTAVDTTRTIPIRYGPNKLHCDLGRRGRTHLLRSYPLLPLLDGSPPPRSPPSAPRSEAGTNIPNVDGAHLAGRAEARDGRACLR